MILIEKYVLSTLAEINDDINYGSISRHPTTADLEKVAELKRLVEKKRIIKSWILLFLKFRD